MRRTLWWLLLLAWLGLAVVVIHDVADAFAKGRTLAAQARYEATHGGVLGTCHECATPRMRWLSRRLVIRRFGPAGPAAVRTALCIVRAESGLNPGAISATSDYGLAQFNKPTWGRIYDWNRILDPVYNVGVMWAMSSRGTDWSAWTGTFGKGLCH